MHTQSFLSSITIRAGYSRFVAGRRCSWHVQTVHFSFNISSSHGEYRMRKLSSTALLSQSNQMMAKARLKQVLDTYIHHRPTVQRLLTAGFVLYCLGTTYQNLSGKGAKGGAREKLSKRGKQGELFEKSVADDRWEEESISLRPPFLRSTKEVDSNRHSVYQVERSSDVSSSLCFLTIEDGDQSIRS